MRTLWRALAVLLWAAAVRADDLALLRGALEADARRPRSATLRLEVYASDQPVTSTIRLAADGQGRARREHLDGPSAGLVVVTEPDCEWRKEPGSDIWQRSLSIGGGETGIAGGDAARIAANYRLSSADGGSFAGRRVIRLELTPKHPGNPRRTLWIDASTRLPLGSATYNRDGQIVARMTVTSVGYAPPEPAAVRLPADARKATGVPIGGLVRVADGAELARRLGRSWLRATRLPEGYRLCGYYLRACREGGWTPVTTYCDGLNTITVSETSGRGRHGHGYGRGRGRAQCVVQSSRLQVVVRRTIGDTDVLVVGDHRREGLEALAMSLVLSRE